MSHQMSSSLGRSMNRSSRTAGWNPCSLMITFRLRRHHPMTAAARRSSLVGVARTAIDHDQPGARTHRREKGLQDRLGSSQLVIGVRNQHRIDRSWRQHRIVDPAANDAHVGVPAERGPDPQKRQRFPAEINRDDPAARTHARCDLQGEVAGARAQIDDRIAAAGIELSKDFFRALPRIALTLHDGERIQRALRLIGDEHHRHDHEKRYEHAGGVSVVHVDVTRSRSVPFRHVRGSSWIRASWA